MQILTFWSKLPSYFWICPTESVNHWSNGEKATKLIEKVLLPYVKNRREELDLHLTKKWLLIADVFKWQWMDKEKTLIEKHHGKMVPVPHNMTNYFQPFDLTVNRSCKSFCVTNLKYACRASAGPNFQGNFPRKCICWFENKNTQVYTRKMCDSVLRSYSHQWGYREKRMAQIWNNQSD